jgi:glycosyltransferase involved in cell wall biosynthesis
MKISIIIPVYNVEERFLYNCIESIINQIYKDIEIILVDDGSTDNSGFICDEFAKKDNRIIVIHQNNVGLAAARNTGLDASTGDFISFIDCDDFINPSMLKDLINTAIQYNVDIVQCGFVKLDEDFKNITPEIFEFSIQIIEQNKALEYFYKDYILSSVMWDKLYRKNVFSKHRFPSGQYQEDAFILSNIYAETDTNIIVINKTYYHYLQRQNSKFHQKYDLNFMESSFKSYKNRMDVALSLNNIKLFKIASNQLASDLFQYYRLIYQNNIKGNKEDFLIIIKYWYNNNKKYFSFYPLKIKLFILYYFPLLIGVFLKINKYTK